MQQERFSRKNFNEVLNFLSSAILRDRRLSLLCSNSKNEEKLALKITKGLLEILLRFESGYILRDEKSIAGVCILIPPGEEIRNIDLIKKGFLFLPLYTGLKGFIFFMRLLDVSSKQNSDLTKNKSHWNIFYYAHNGKPASVKKLNGIIKEIIRESNVPVFSQTFNSDTENHLAKTGFITESGIEFTPDLLLRAMITKNLKYEK